MTDTVTVASPLCHCQIPAHVSGRAYRFRSLDMSAMRKTVNWFVDAMSLKSSTVPDAQ